MFQKDNKAAPVADFVMPDGIYFNMVEDIYFSLHRFSASGMKAMLVSPANFWSESWMNSDKERKEVNTFAQLLGSAYHAAIFEPETFHDRYVSEPNFDGIKDLLTSDQAVCAELKALGMTQKKSGETTDERALRLLEQEPSFTVKSLAMSEFYAGLKGQKPIAAMYWRQIIRDLERIQENPTITEAVNGGASEVTILWTCPDSGIKMKSRIDKLKSDRFVDLKTFANPSRKPVNQVMMEATRYNQYYLSMRSYQSAIEQISAQDLQIMDMPTDDDLVADDSWPPKAYQDLIADLKLRAATPLPPYLFFQEKNGVPNMFLRPLKLHQYPDGVDAQSIGAEDHSIAPTRSAICMKADLEIAHAKALFTQYSDVYGQDGAAWFPFELVQEMGDADFNGYWLEETPQ